MCRFFQFPPGISWVKRSYLHSTLQYGYFNVGRQVSCKIAILVITLLFCTGVGVSPLTAAHRNQTGVALSPRSDYRAASRRCRLGPNAARRSPGQLPQEAALHPLPVHRSQPAQHPAEVPAVQGGGVGEVLKGNVRVKIKWKPSRRVPFRLLR